ncbi:probable ATP-dependent RNA helicase DDX47 [Cyclospora cayetanensis]|uniref:Probable ATP-dependent RNA helicase DDX47 n=1 Tax=Cyclospora cayetanensis TaxID=88456 RepID=A0A6P6S1L2_9EIME|nr:probable ATP-dependent RNA helicase DDX47 [Cyclospora cayetanensis]
MGQGEKRPRLSDDPPSAANATAAGSSREEGAGEQLPAHDDPLVQQEQQQQQQQQQGGPATFKSLGLCREICAAAAAAKWATPTAVQQQVIPLALQQLHRLRGADAVQHRDIIALAATGSGKTGAFVLPLLHELLQQSSSSRSRSLTSSSSAFAVILAPTRELALQVFDWVQSLAAAAAAAESTAAAVAAAAAAIRGCCCALVGGVDFSLQALSLAKKPQILVCTPGRLIDHLHRTKGFSVKGCRYIVMDEADKLLCPEYAEEISRLLAAAPKEKVVLLFSATMTSSVCKLNKACLVKPIKVSVDKKTATAPVLLQQFLLLPLKHKWTYAAALLQQHRSFNSIMIFTNTCLAARKLATYLRHMAFDAVCLHGQMTQPQRIGALAKFRAGEVRILVTTEVGSRGLDISQVEFVLNFDVPLSSKDYIHRVGRTARAGRSGRALTFVTQYDVEAYQRIEFALEKKLEEYADLPEEKALAFHERALEALRETELELHEAQEARSNKKRKHNQTNRKRKA